MISSWDAKLVAVHDGYGELEHIDCVPWIDEVDARMEGEWNEPRTWAAAFEAIAEEKGEPERELLMRYNLHEWRDSQLDNATFLTIEQLSREGLVEWDGDQVTIDMSDYAKLYCTQCEEEIE